MKNVMVIDGAENCAYDVYSMPDELFILLFPGVDQNISFIEDVLESGVEMKLNEYENIMWSKPLKKIDVNGIDGILFYELRDKKSRFYPNRRDSDLDRVGRPGALYEGSPG